MISILKSINDFGLKLLVFFSPLFFLGIGLFSTYDANRKLVNCTYETVATITNVRENRDRNSYALDYTYEYNGQIYNHIDNIYSNDYSKYHVGDTISILVNPDKPKEQLFDMDTAFGKYFIIGGLVHYGIYAFLDIIELRAKKWKK